jgi:hypothetical protein
MSDPQQPKSGGGCFSKLLFLVLLAALGGLGLALVAVAVPQDLSDLGGRSPAARSESTRDLKLVLKNAIDRGYPLTLSETEINQWLAKTVVARQGGVLNEGIKLEGVWVRLEEGRAEVIMERSILGKPFTVSMFVQVERVEGPKGQMTEVNLHGGSYHKDVPNPPMGGRFGKLVIPQGFLLLVMPAYEKLATLLKEEIELGFQEMSKITIENDRIILDPRQTMGDLGMPLNF